MSKIEDAMLVLENAACGGVGHADATLDELRALWENGEVYGNDSYADTCQHAYRLLEIAYADYKRLEDVVRLIADYGGDQDEELGLNMNGRWCREQARTVLEEIKNR
jgi:hypothetical protein